MSRHPERHSARPAVRAAACAALALALALTGCTGPDAAADPTPTATVAPSPSATPSPTTPSGPSLIADGTAEDNLPFFSIVVAGVWASAENASGRAYVDALAAAGFEKADMQVTPDQTTVGNPAETIQFSVKWADECLVGQVGPATGAPVAVVVPALDEGTCLIGQTRPIDW